MKHMLKTLAGMTVFAVASAFPAKADTVSMFCSATDYELCEKAVQKWTKDTGHEVKLNRMPQNLDDAIPIYQTWTSSISTSSGSACSRIISSI
jgi:trehalose/maltose transport system substrate-binding protein